MVAVGGRRHAGVSFKFFAEIIQIIKSDTLTDLRDAQFGMCQKLAGMTQPDLCHICHRTGI